MEFGIDQNKFLEPNVLYKQINVILDSSLRDLYIPMISEEIVLIAI
jgi:hypothetical protein